MSQSKQQQTQTGRGNVPVAIEEMLTVFGELFDRETVQGLLAEVEKPQEKYAWQILTPLVAMWGLVYQRLSQATLDDVVGHLQSGAADELDAGAKDKLPLSKRIKSDSNSAYAQARKRQPEGLLRRAYQRVAQEASRVAGDVGVWHGHHVRLLDGSTHRLPPKADIIANYGRPPGNQEGNDYWVQVRSLVACDAFTQAVVGMNAGPITQSEQALLPAVLQEDPVEAAVYLGDQNFGVYSVVQALHGTGKHALLRMKKQRAYALLKRQADSSPLLSGQSRSVVWSPSRKDQPFAQWPTEPVAGRLIYLRLEPDGFKPTDLFLLRH